VLVDKKFYESKDKEEYLLKNFIDTKIETRYFKKIYFCSMEKRSRGLQNKEKKDLPKKLNFKLEGL